MKNFQQIREAVDSTDTGGKEEVSMATKQIKAMRHFLDGIEERVKSAGDMEEWYQNKLTKANDYLKTLYSYGKGDQNESVEEGYASAAQRKAVWAARNDEKEKNKKEDSDAVKAFLAKGGKIKKLPPGKAQGYHGKDDPGKDVRGVMDKPDTKAIGTRKKVKSMAKEGVNERSAERTAAIDKARGGVTGRQHGGAPGVARQKGMNPDHQGRGLKKTDGKFAQHGQDKSKDGKIAGYALDKKDQARDSKVKTPKGLADLRRKHGKIN